LENCKIVCSYLKEIMKLLFLSVIKEEFQALNIGEYKQLFVSVKVQTV